MLTPEQEAQRQRVISAAIWWWAHQKEQADKDAKGFNLACQELFVSVDALTPEAARGDEVESDECQIVDAK